MKKSQFLMTTSPNFEGLEIESYLGVVTSNVVTGTGLFSDIAASFSDFFGGRSNAYKNQLESIRVEAFQELESKARGLGANALISLSIDNDQISGKNTQMLMISVCATAVKLKQCNAQQLNGIPENDSLTLTPDEVLQQYRIHKLKSLDEHMSLESVFNADPEAFAAAPSVAIARILVKHFLTLQFKPLPKSAGVLHFLEYLSLLPAEDVTKVIYQEIEQLKNPLKAIEYVQILASELNVFDAGLISKLLDNESKLLANYALILCASKPTRYKYSDISKIQQLLEKVEQKFPTVREVIEHKKMIGKSLIWKCANSHDVDANTDICPQCFFTRRDAWYSSYEHAEKSLKGETVKDFV